MIVRKSELPQTQEDTKGLAVDMDDVLIYAIYPVTGKKFLHWKYGQEDPPPEVLPRTLEKVKAEQELLKKAKAGLLVESSEKEAPAKGEHLRTFNVFVDDDHFEVGVEAVGGAPVVSYVQPTAAPMPAPVAVAPAMPAAPACISS